MSNTKATNTEESSDDSLCRISNTSSVTSIFSDCGTKPKFRFPPPPRLAKSETNSYNSDSSNSDYVCQSGKRRNRSFCKRLPPLGIFWDIENCQVPRAKSASDIVQRIRQTFLRNYRESEFIVVCDVTKENPQVIQDLHDSQVNLIHVSATSKNAADEKLRQSLRRFAELHPSPSGIVLISSDINYAADLADLRYRKKIRVILVHNINVKEALMLCANEHHNFQLLMEDLPDSKTKLPTQPFYLSVTNLPVIFDKKRLKCRLRLLTDNCGGRVMEIDQEMGLATLKFTNLDSARRAQRRIQGEDVFGNKIKVLPPTVRNYAGRKLKNGNASFQSNCSMAPPGFTTQEFAQNCSYSSQTGSRDSRKMQDYNQTQENFTFRPIRGMGANNNNIVTPMDVSYEHSWAPRRGGDRHSRGQHDGALGLPSRIHKVSGSSDFSDDGKSSDGAKSNLSINQPVDLIISNLDPTIDVKELRRLLTNMLKEYAMILSLNVLLQADGSPVANIRVNSQQEAQFTISQLHRQKLGHKRIVISYAQNNSPDPEQLRAMVIKLLQEVPDQCMPLFKFIELLESHYHCTVSVSEVNKLKDICKISDDLGSRIISLSNEFKSSPPPNLSRTLVPYCTIHCPNGLQSRGWGEISTIQTPNIMMSLSIFETKLNGLLSSHLGYMPLLSFQSCYEQEYHEPLPVDDNGVPLEHLVSCVTNVEIKCAGPNKNIKVIKQEIKIMESDEETVLKAVPPSLAPNISLLCRELVDLLKTTDRCQLLLSKFIPAYHHHFGRQCRVADYGYTKLLDLFESISHVVQIMGDGTRKVITLTHSAQMRRFTSDLLRVLKVQPAKQITLLDFPAAYEKVMNKTFNAVEYGLCTFEDLLHEVPENTVVVSKCDEGIYIAVPKREQTSDEIMRTKQFAAEVVDLLRHAPYYTMLFNRFVPAYHHHFGHQCKVSDYGFAKLIELFEAIPDIVKIEELADGERTVSLTLKQSLKILGTQIVQVIKSTKSNSIQLENLATVYLRECGYPLKPQMYECETVSDIVEMLSDHVQVIRGSGCDTLVTALDLDVPSALNVRSWALLLSPPHSKDIPTFKYEYQTRYNSGFSMVSLQQLENVVTISSGNDNSYITLTALYILAAQLYHMLYNNGGSALYNNLEKLYHDCYGKPLKLSSYNIHSMDEFYTHFNQIFFIRGSKKKSVVVLNRNLAEHLVPLPPSMYNSSHFAKRENVQWPAPPSQELVQNTVKKVTPPKPDTPPTPGGIPWNHWTSTTTFESLNLSIQLPIGHNPKLLGNPDELISPARHLLSVNRNPWVTVPSIAAPHPTELPMPDKLMSKGGVMSDDSDSGCNTKLENSPSDNEIDFSSEQRYLNSKPHFATFLNFNN